MNTIIKQTLSNSGFELNIEAYTKSRKLDSTTSNLIVSCSDFKIILGFTTKVYSEGTHISEISVVISRVDKVHLKCDLVDGSILMELQNKSCLVSIFVLLQNRKLKKEPTTVLCRKINKSRLDKIQCFLENDNNNPVNFNNETLTFSFQIIMIYLI